MRVFLFICVFLFFCVFLLGRPRCAVFPALFVCRNMAELNLDDPSFWFNDVLAEDEAIVDASDYAGSISVGDSDTVTLTTLNSVGCIRVKMKNSWHASRAQ